MSYSGSYRVSYSGDSELNYTVIPGNDNRNNAYRMTCKGNMQPSLRGDVVHEIGCCDICSSHGAFACMTEQHSHMLYPP